MDENRLARSVRRGKRFNYICFSILIIFTLTAAVAVILYMTRPLSDSVTLESEESALGGESILVKTSSGYYEIDGSSAFSDLFRLDEWTSCDQFPDVEVVATLHFGELYEMYLHGDGKVSFFDGYARLGTRQTAYYEVPAGIAEEVIGYIEENGTVRTLGDGAIAMSTFFK
jgi:hypothetical protein